MKSFLESANLLETIVSGAEENNEGARAVTADLNEAQLNWKPSPDQWSIAQCLEHLTMAMNQFDKYFVTALERARKKSPVSDPPPYKPSMMGAWLAKYVNPVSPRKLKAPKIFQPGAASNIPQSLDQFLDAQAKFI